jgi:hypothetical protein
MSHETKYSGDVQFGSKCSWDFLLRHFFYVGVEETTLGLLRPYSLVHEVKGRNLTTDRYYSSVDLADALQEEFHMTFLGTLRNNRKGLPKVQ